jgi:hypothetical protein
LTLKTNWLQRGLKVISFRQSLLTDRQAFFTDISDSSIRFKEQQARKQPLKTDILTLKHQSAQIGKSLCRVIPAVGIFYFLSLVITITFA